MKKKFIIRKNFEFANIINQNKRYSNQYFSIYIAKNNLKSYRFGISIPKRIGNAVIRNRLKRQLKAILRLNINCYKPIDYVIIVREALLKLNYQAKKSKLFSLLLKINKELKDEN